MHYDRRGLRVTTESAAAIADLDRATRSILAHRRDAGTHLGRALASDPDLAIAHVVMGFAQMLLARGELVTTARRHAAEARRCLEARGGTAREKALTRSLELWLAGAMEASAAHLEHALRADPLDALAFKICYSVRFMLGDVSGMRRATEIARRTWSGSVPDYGFIEGCHAFALEESGELDEAERIGRLALVHEPEDAWGCHSVAHVYETRGDALGGAAWLGRRRSDFSELNNLARHLAWHEALFRLTLGDREGVLALYDREIRNERTDDYRDIANAASLLWRLERQRVGVGDRWEELADLAAARIQDSALVFARLHYLMCLRAAGRVSELAEMLACMRREARLPRTTQARVLAAVGLPLGELIADPLGMGSEPAAWPGVLRLGRIGGSRVQRAVFHMILADAVAPDTGSRAPITPAKAA
jgi:tetratricopeptide (TPR) repeat protein